MGRQSLLSTRLYITIVEPLGLGWDMRKNLDRLNTYHDWRLYVQKSRHFLQLTLLLQGLLLSPHTSYMKSLWIHYESTDYITIVMILTKP